MHKPADIKHEPGARRALYLGLALGVALVYFAVMTGSAVSRGYAEAAATFKEQQLAALVAARQPGEVTVVMLGNSRLRYALTHGFDPAEGVKLPDGRTLRVVQYAEDVALFQSYLPLWPEILRIRPDMIVFVDLLFSTERRSARVSLRNMSAVMYDYVVRTLTGRSDREEWERARRDIVDACLTSFPPEKVEDRLIFAAHRDRHSLDGNPNTDAARRAVDQAVRAGIPVAVLRFPSNLPVYDAYGVPAHLIDYYGLGYVPSREQLLPARHGDVQWLEYPRPPVADYCDFVHLNARGRVAFSEWFRARVSQSVPR
jgi:hypothetical protein